MQSLRAGAEVLGLTEVKPRHIHDYLVLLDATKMPLTVDETLAIHFVRILHSAGMIEAEIPARAAGSLNYSTPAKVSRLTQWGLEVVGKDRTERGRPGARELWS